jgi:hypothetical protein
LLTKLYVIMMSVILKTIRISRIEKNLTQEVVAKKLNSILTITIQYYYFKKKRKNIAALKWISQLNKMKF